MANKIYSPKDMDDFLNKIFLPVESNTTDNIYRGAYWLIYLGIDKDELGNIKWSDVDLKNLYINYKNNQIPIYKEAIATFKALHSDKIKIGKLNESTKTNLEDVLGLKTGETTARRIKSSMWKKFKRKERELPCFTFKDIELFGIYYRALISDDPNKIFKNYAENSINSDKDDETRFKKSIYDKKSRISRSYKQWLTERGEIDA